MYTPSLDYQTSLPIFDHSSQLVDFNNVWGCFLVSSVVGVNGFTDSQFGHIFTYRAYHGKIHKNNVAVRS